MTPQDLTTKIHDALSLLRAMPSSPHLLYSSSGEAIHNALILADKLEDCKDQEANAIALHDPKLRQAFLAVADALPIEVEDILSAVELRSKETNNSLRIAGVWLSEANHKASRDLPSYMQSIRMS